MAAAALKHADPHALDGAGHYQKIHRTPHGTVIVWERLVPGKRWLKIEPYHPAAALLGPYQGKVDVYLTVNEFQHWRLIRNLKSLRACYVDIDGSTDWEDALEVLREAKMPAPSFMVLSGRGIHFYWILEPVPAQALPVWQRVQDALVNALTPVGADYRAKDCTRLLRLVGTINAKNGEEVIGRTLNNNVWTLHELADEVLGPRVQQPARVLDFKAHAARRRHQDREAGKQKGSIYAWWYLVYRDLCTIADHYWFGGVPDGKRDTMLFLMANALSWYAHPESLSNEIIKTARTFTPTLTKKDVETYTRPILKRATDAAAGRKYEWQGKEVDPRYAFRAETIREWLGGTNLIVPELWPDLRALAPKEVIHERRREREKVRETRNRAAEGRYGANNTGQGYRAGQEEKRATARLMRAQGQSIRVIATALDVSVNTIQRWCA